MTEKRRPTLTPRGPRAARRRHERGAILIHVAIAMVGLLAFSAFSIDHGVMMVSRGQAQNAADAAAWAAGLYLAWDDATDQPGAQAIAVVAAQQNGVWGSAPDITTTDVTFPTCPPGSPGPVDTCVRVDVYRNQRPGGNPLPVFFSSLIGVADQGVRATATAQVLYGAAANCMLPFAIPDRWLEQRLTEGTDPPGGIPDATDSPLNFPFDEPEGMTNLPDGYWDPEGDTYDAFVTQGQQGGNPLGGLVDLYAPGPPLMGGTGFDAFRDYGIQVLLKASNGSEIAPSTYYPVVLPDGMGTGAPRTGNGSRNAAMPRSRRTLCSRSRRGTWSDRPRRASRTSSRWTRAPLGTRRSATRTAPTAASPAGAWAPAPVAVAPAGGPCRSSTSRTTCRDTGPGAATSSSRGLSGSSSMRSWPGTCADT